MTEETPDYLPVMDKFHAMKKCELLLSGLLSLMEKHNISLDELLKFSCKMMNIDLKNRRKYDRIKT